MSAKTLTIAFSRAAWRYRMLFQQAEVPPLFTRALSAQPSTAWALECRY